jgi:hypothetical protein
MIKWATETILYLKERSEFADYIRKEPEFDEYLVNYIFDIVRLESITKPIPMAEVDAIVAHLKIEYQNAIKRISDNYEITLHWDDLKVLSTSTDRFSVWVGDNVSSVKNGNKILPIKTVDDSIVYILVNEMVVDKSQPLVFSCNDLDIYTL